MPDPHPHLTVSGDNPYTLSFRDSRLTGAQQPQRGQHHVLIRWKIKKPECMKVTVTPDASSTFPITVAEPVRDANGTITGYRNVNRSPPNRIKVLVECGDCTCGSSFSAEVEYHYYIYAAVQSAWVTGKKTFTLYCAGPGCQNDIIIQDASYGEADLQEFTALLPAEQVEQLGEGKPLSIEPGKEEIV